MSRAALLEPMISASSGTTGRLPPRKKRLAGRYIGCRYLHWTQVVEDPVVLNNHGVRYGVVERREGYMTAIRHTGSRFSSEAGSPLRNRTETSNRGPACCTMTTCPW